MGLDAMILVFWMLSFKPAFPFFSFTFIKSSLVPLHFLPQGWCHLHIWSCLYFSWQSWFQLVSHPAQYFVWCTLHINIFLSRIWYFIGKQWSKNVLKWQNTWCSSPKTCVIEVCRTEEISQIWCQELVSGATFSDFKSGSLSMFLNLPQGCTGCWLNENTVSFSLRHIFSIKYQLCSRSQSVQFLDKYYTVNLSNEMQFVLHSTSFCKPTPSHSNKKEMSCKCFCICNILVPVSKFSFELQKMFLLCSVGEFLIKKTTLSPSPFSTFS